MDGRARSGPGAATTARPGARPSPGRTVTPRSTARAHTSALAGRPGALPATGAIRGGLYPVGRVSGAASARARRA